MRSPANIPAHPSPSSRGSSGNRSAPPAEAAPVSAREAANLFADIEKSASVVLAVSGGPDSTALLFLAARWRAARRRGPRLVAITVDHGLRPGSAQEAKQVKRLAARLRVEHRTLRWTGRKPATGLQAAARAARYRLLLACARKADAREILTAHTLDDQAETVLFRLARGSGLKGLLGMARVSALDHVSLIRPLLEIPKTRLVATLEAARIPFIEDPSNADPRFARSRLRQLASALASEGLDAKRLAALAARLRRVEAALAAATEKALAQLCREGSTEPWGAVMDAHAFAELPAEIGLRVLGQLIGRFGREGPVELGKLERMLEAVLGSGSARGRLRRTLAGALVTADDTRIVVEAAPARKKPAKAGKLARSRSQAVKASFTGGR
jgi:tRNA(Ile)-lysidine synthase